MVSSQDLEMTLYVEVDDYSVGSDSVASSLVFVEQEAMVVVEHPCEEAGSSWEGLSLVAAWSCLAQVSRTDSKQDHVFAQRDQCRIVVYHKALSDKGCSQAAQVVASSYLGEAFEACLVH